MVELSEDVRERVEAPNFWHLATLSNDGSPHVTPMWVDLEGDYVVFNTAIGRVKEENLRRDPRVSLSNIDPANPYDRVEIRGRVVRFVEGEEAERCMDRLAKKYVGEDVYPWPIPGERRIMMISWNPRASATSLASSRSGPGCCRSRKPDVLPVDVAQRQSSPAGSRTRAHLVGRRLS